MRFVQRALMAALLLSAAPAGANPPPCVEIPVPEHCEPCAGVVSELVLVNTSDLADALLIWQSGYVVFCDTIAPCRPFSFYEGHWPHPRGGDLRLEIDGELHATIPMDCSADVRPGTMFGHYMVVSATSTLGGRLCPVPADCPPPPPPSDCGKCDGKVTELTLRYTGAAATIRVDQKKDAGTVFNAPVATGGVFSFSGTDKNGTLGTEITLYVNGTATTRIHTSCSQPIGPGMVFGAFEVVAGASRNGGALCPQRTPPSDPKPCDCEGKVTVLSLRYHGTGANAAIRVQQKDGVVIFDDLVVPGSFFTFDGKDKHGTMGTEITIFINGASVARIHTSCSQPIGPGLFAGDFEVLFGESREGGPLCPVAANAQGGGAPKAPK